MDRQEAPKRLLKALTSTARKGEQPDVEGVTCTAWLMGSIFTSPGCLDWTDLWVCRAREQLWGRRGIDCKDFAAHPMPIARWDADTTCCGEWNKHQPGVLFPITAPPNGARGSRETGWDGDARSRTRPLLRPVQGLCQSNAGGKV